MVRSRHLHHLHHQLFLNSIEVEAEQKFVKSELLDQESHDAHMIRTFENLLLRNQIANDLEIWYAALMAQAFSVLFN